MLALLVHSCTDETAGRLRRKSVGSRMLPQAPPRRFRAPVWVGFLEASPSGRPCRSYGARLLRAGASEGWASPGLAGEALLSRDGVARRLRESAQLLRTCSATLPRPVAGNGALQGGGLRALW